MEGTEENKDSTRVKEVGSRENQGRLRTREKVLNEGDVENCKDDKGDVGKVEKRNQGDRCTTWS